MIKHLVKSEAEFIAFIVRYLCKAQKEYGDENIEDIFGVEFYNKKGQLFSEFEGKDNEDDFDGDSDDDFTRYKVKNPELLPEEYPCVVLIEFSQDFDRVGDMETQFVEYIYLSDFVEKTSAIKWTSTNKMTCGFQIVSESNHTAFVEMPSMEIGPNLYKSNTLTEEELKEFDKLNWNQKFDLYLAAKDRMKKL